jgi:Protein of unknown function (DUF2721)
VLQSATTVSGIAHIIQLAIAPVFLLSGTGALLAVLTNRLGRIIDRGRALEELLGAVEPPRERAEMVVELNALVRRARLINLAISLCTASALLVCLVIVALFVGDFVTVPISGWVAALFIAAMLLLIVALVSFLREVRIATMTLRFGAAEAIGAHSPGEILMSVPQTLVGKVQRLVVRSLGGR